MGSPMGLSWAFRPVIRGLGPVTEQEGLPLTSAPWGRLDHCQEETVLGCIVGDVLLFGQGL